MPTLSALMSVYHATDAAELELTLNSLDAQTRPADEVVVVFDGEVSGAVRGVVAKHGARVVELPENVGLGRALNAGLATINATYTARIDSDDAAKPERFAKQLAYLEAHPDVAALGSAMEEFEHTPGDRGTIRALPRDPNAYVKINSPLNHPAVTFRTDAVKAVGGYQHVPFMEDYDLWARLIAAGHTLANLDEPLTYFRVTDDQLRRRASADTRRAERTMQANLVEYGLISRPRALANLAVRNLYRALPIGLTKRVYSVLFHRGE
ncbi:glycosyltransferase [uncultured Corynebacterium sp.]|uniref:glycosyltransferase n=1 Tax=uncultured Corynebacterium sp. TaxID=159447 RepID=UPI0025925A1D|nr:glycosyltransferase [uncultured Corynebacterium sp.]